MMAGGRDRQRAGQGLVEYAVLLGTLALVVVGVLAATGTSVGDVFRRSSHALVVQPTPSGTPQASPTPIIETATCSAPVSFSGAGTLMVECNLGKSFSELISGEISLEGVPPDDHLVTVLSGGASHVFRGRQSSSGQPAYTGPDAMGGAELDAWLDGVELLRVTFNSLVGEAGSWQGSIQVVVRGRPSGPAGTLPPSTPTSQATTTPVPTPTPTPTPEPRPHLVLAELKYWSSDEYVKIVNDGTAPQDMTGWRLLSVKGNQWYTFPAGYVLSPGGAVYVHSGLMATSNPPVHLRWTRKNIWHDKGDTAVLYDSAGNEVSRLGY